MLRISTTKAVATLAVILVGLMLAVPSLLHGRAAQGLHRRAAVLVPDLDRADPRHRARPRTSRAVRRSCSSRPQRPRAEHGEAWRRRRTPALREAGVQASGGIQLLPRGVQLRITDEAARAKACRSCSPCRSRSPTRPLVPDRRPHPRPARGAERPDPLAFSDAGFNAGAPRGGPGDRGDPPAASISGGTTEPFDPAAGRRPHPGPGPGDHQDPARSRSSSARPPSSPFRMLADSPAGDVDMLPSKDANGPEVPVERRVLGRRRRPTDAQPGFVPEVERADRQLQVQPARAQIGQATSENVGRALAIVLDNEVVSAPRILQPITAGRARSRAGSRSSRPTTSRVAAARRRPAGQAHRDRAPDRRPGPRRDSIEAGTARHHRGDDPRRRADVRGLRRVSACSPTSRCWSMSA